MNSKHYSALLDWSLKQLWIFQALFILGFFHKLRFSSYIFINKAAVHLQVNKIMKYVFYEGKKAGM